MRREAGAVLVLLTVLLIKLPGLIRDYRWSEAVSNPGGLSDSIAAAVLPSRVKSASAPHRSDSIRSRPLSTQSASGDESSASRATSTPGISFPSSTPRNKHTNVPKAFLENPLRYLSSAPPESLVLLPGIGPVIAERIANAAGGKRPFTRWEDLLSVKGIGAKKLERLRQIADEP